MKTSFFRYRYYIVLSSAFVIINVLTLEHLAPWIDEVMFLDTSYNAAVHGRWETTAWYRVAGQYPFSTYPPLYQLLAAAWIWLFGGSLVAVRSMNLLVMLLLGMASLRLMRRQGFVMTTWTELLFTVLLWGTSEVAVIYRNGRPDMLCALAFVLAVSAIDRHLSARSQASRVAVVFTSTCLLCSGIQAAVCLCVLWLFLFVVNGQRRMEVARLLPLLMAGLLTGLLAVAFFMLAHGRLLPFASSVVQYSATLKSIALAVLPWTGEVFGFASEPYTQKLLQLGAEPSLAERLISLTEYHTFFVLAVIALLAYATCFRCDLKGVLRDKGFLSLLFALCVPVMMTLAGRFPFYYRWMAFLPLVASVVWVAAKHRHSCAVFSAVAIVMAAFGLRTMRPSEHWDYDNLRSFVQRQHFRQADNVVCPFLAFYEMKPVCDTCYFAGIFPTEYIGHANYIIEAPDGGEFDRPITDYVYRLKSDTTIELSIVDRCEDPSLILYHVRKKNE